MLNYFCNSRILWAYLCRFVSGFSVSLIYELFPLNMPRLDRSNCIINLEIRPVLPTLFFFSQNCFGWGDGSISQSCVRQAWGCECNSETPREKADVMVCTCNPSTGEVQLGKAGQSGLFGWSRPMVEPVSRSKVDGA